MAEFMHVIYEINMFPTLRNDVKFAKRIKNSFLAVFLIALYTFLLELSPVRYIHWLVSEIIFRTKITTIYPLACGNIIN